MPFPKCKIKLNMSFGSSPRETYTEDKETGVCIPKTEECNKKLPDAENFKIENQLKAGVTLNEVNTKVLNGNGVNIPELEQAIEKATKTKKTNKSETTKE